jgi:quercetin dioxygenase-like cupin family protein
VTVEPHEVRFVNYEVDVPRIFRILESDALEVRDTPFGSVGKVFRGQGIEVVWVRKQDEAVDPDWFSQPMLDLLLVVQGKLKVEFERPDLEPCILGPGDLLVLPPNTRCRGYRWPREAAEATVFVAVYPTG